MADVYCYTEDDMENSKIDESDDGPSEEASLALSMSNSGCGEADASESTFDLHSTEGEEEEEEEEDPSGLVHEGVGVGGIHSDEDEDDGCIGQDDVGHGDGMGTITPLQRLLKCAHSENYFDRQMVARSIQETLRAVVETPDDVYAVLEIMMSLLANDEPSVRTELMEQVPQIAVLCHEYPDRLGNVIPNTLMPMVVKHLTDPNDQARKTSQAALLVLLEQELVAKSDVHDQVCPVILNLTKSGAVDDFKTEAVALMSKMAPLIGREMTERLFLERFTRLCSDSQFQVRKVCAANFGEFCSVVGTQPAEDILLCKFVHLCKDGVWGVRKACAEVFMSVSCACSLIIRKEKLSPVFVSLLTDQSRWVRVAAFQNLGPFISTFADPSVTGLHYNEEGILVIGTPQHSLHQQQQLNADNVVTTDTTDVEDTGGMKEDRCSNEVKVGEDGGGDDDDGGGGKEEGGKVNLNIMEIDEELSVMPSKIQKLQVDNKELSTEKCTQTGTEDLLRKNCVSSTEEQDMEVEVYPHRSYETCNEKEVIEKSPEELHAEACRKTPGEEIVATEMSQHNQDLEQSEKQIRTNEAIEATTSNTDSSKLDCSEHQKSFGMIPDQATLTEQQSSLPKSETPFQASPSSNSLTVSGSGGHLHVHIDNPAFNTFNFWRLPLPQIELDIDIMGPTTNVCVKAKVQDSDTTYQSQVNLTMANNLVQPPVTLTSKEDTTKKTCTVKPEVSLPIPQLKEEKPKCLESSYEHEIKAVLDELLADVDGHFFNLDINKESKEVQSDESKVTSVTQPEQPMISSVLEGKVEKSEVVEVSGPQQATYAQVCAASVTSVQQKHQAQPSILASRFTQAQVGLSGGTVTEIKKREMDVMSPSDSVFPSMAAPRLDDGIVPQHRRDPFTISSQVSLESNMFSPPMDLGSSNDNSLTQDIVPKKLLEHYISMTDPMRAETVDNELTKHCAYSLPAVALTLGRQNWPVLKDTYETLAGDMHWKVRRTLAFSIHELAVILGADLAHQDLVPIFNGFIKDLDEVRIGVLKHLANFLRLLHPDHRRDYLPKMDEFLRTDNEHNWRFRLELAIQLGHIIDLFSPQDCHSYLVPIALQLVADKVVRIRNACYTVISQLVRQLGCEGDTALVESLGNMLVELFAQAKSWSRRQTYAFLCGHLVAQHSCALEDWCRMFLKSLIDLADDKVPNVRIAVAKTLATYVVTLEYFQIPERTSSGMVKEAVERLQKDSDRDVRYFASTPVSTMVSIDPQEPSL
ncbi:serine/threonine-protein phosphatase 4 regulatory subunit 1-like isoform X3 [Oratosquilla oratoria]|uniref:serine/threonine-protein phosphatase 4 regulatory subunit 1-like isoform X3 n=2 Tax=Oratosquilla oratoria TaxID=337810 RepID=UPI003F763065